MSFAEDVDSVMGELRTMLIEKNKGYGNSALEPMRIFSKADNLEQIRVRIDDKLSRIMRGNGVIKEDTVFDLMGYLVLMRVAQRQQRAAIRIEPDTPIHIEPGGDDGRVRDPMLKIATAALEAEASRVEPQMKQSLNLTKADLTIPKFPHDKTLEKSYKTLFYVEYPDGRVVLKYMSNLLHTTKDIISRLPYPMPKAYLKNSGLTVNQATGIRFYQQLLFTSKISENTKKNTAKMPDRTTGAPGTDPNVPEAADPDRPYKKFLNTNTRPNLEEEKVEGDLNG